MKTFSDLYGLILTEAFDTPTAAETTRAKAVLNEGYIEFCRDLFAAGGGQFLVCTDTLSITEANDGIEKLPEDFEAMVLPPVLADTGYSSYPPLIERPADWIRTRRTATSEVENTPQFYAVEPADWDEEVGQAWQIIVYPLPNADCDYTIQYRMAVVEMSNDDEYPRGGQMHEAAILQAARMVLERARKVTDGPQARAYYQIHLPASIRADRRTVPINRGGAPLQRRISRINGVTYSTD